MLDGCDLKRNVVEKVVLHLRRGHLHKIYKGRVKQAENHSRLMDSNEETFLTFWRCCKEISLANCIYRKGTEQEVREIMVEGYIMWDLIYPWKYFEPEMNWRTLHDCELYSIYNILLLLKFILSLEWLGQLREDDKVWIRESSCEVNITIQARNCSS